MYKNIYYFNNYKEYLKYVILSRPSKGHGYRTQLAKALGCQVAFVSQVLNKGLHLNLDQAENLNGFLNHTREEALFFLLLVQYARAGSEALRERLSDQIKEFQEKRLSLKNHIEIKEKLTAVDQATYYSSWHYAAVHMAISLPKLQTRETLCAHFHVSTDRMNEVLDFLLQIGLIEQKGEKYLVKQGRVFLLNDSPMILKHHANWRMKAIEALDRTYKSDLHLSTVITMSRKDALQIKELLIQAVQEARKIVRNSNPDEELQCLCLDFFSV